MSKTNKNKAPKREGRGEAPAAKRRSLRASKSREGAEDENNKKVTFSFLAPKNSTRLDEKVEKGEDIRGLEKRMKNRI